MALWLVLGVSEDTAKKPQSPFSLSLSVSEGVGDQPEAPLHSKVHRVMRFLGGGMCRLLKAESQSVFILFILSLSAEAPHPNPPLKREGAS